MRTRGWKSIALFVVSALVGVVGVGVVASPAMADSTTVVTQDSVSANGPWSLEAPDTSTGSYSFVDGPATPPSGTGSLAMSIASGQHEWLNNYQYGACTNAYPACTNTGAVTPLANLSALGFSTYRASGSTMPSLNIEVYTTGTSNYDTLAFVPNPGSVVNNTWQSWDGMNPSDGVWYSSHNLGTAPFNCSPFACSASWSQVTAGLPNAVVEFGIGPNAGSGGTFTGNIDNMVVGVSGNTTTYDFERDECTTTCYVDPVNGNDANIGSSANPLKTIQAGVDTVQSGGTVIVDPGTAVENVVVDNSVTIQGSGQGSTIVEPASSNPNPGDCSGASLCPDASNVFLVQANNVTIDNLTVDGDNPSLTSGITADGADLDARNGIITNHLIPGAITGLSVHDVTVQNIYLRGIYSSTNGGTFNFSNDTVDNVQADASSIGVFAYTGSGVMSANHVSNASDAIASNWSNGIQFTNNVVTASGSGVHTDNSGEFGSSDLISGNTVSSCTSGGLGVWAFVPYTAVTVTNNTISGCDIGMAAYSSCALGGASSCPGGVIPTASFTGNTVTGTAGGKGFVVTTTTVVQGGTDFGDGSVQVEADHNVISGAQYGVYVEETGGQQATAVVSRNSLGGNTSLDLDNTGATSVDARCNWWGLASPRPVADGLASGPMTVAPWLNASNLDSNCIPIMHIGALTHASVVEGDTGTTSVSFPVSLDRPSNQTVTVNWNTVDGTATAPSDYTAASGTLTFTPGQTLRYITVTVNGDTQLEDLENFNVHLSGTHGAVLAKNTKVVDILNDDKPTMSLANVSVTEGGLATFTVHLAQRYYQPITVTLSSANGSATAPGDYTAISPGTTVTIPAGDPSATFSVQTHTDGQTEGNETFTVTATAPSTNDSPRTATGTIQANST